MWFIYEINILTSQINPILMLYEFESETLIWFTYKAISFMNKPNVYMIYEFMSKSYKHALRMLWVKPILIWIF